MKSSHSENRRFAAVCGEYCLRCLPTVESRCRGCAYELGRTPDSDCAIFQCAVAERGIEHCGLCPDFPCDLFRSSADLATVERRIEALRRRQTLGTDRWLEEQE